MAREIQENEFVRPGIFVSIFIEKGEKFFKNGEKHCFTLEYRYFYFLYTS